MARRFEAGNGVLRKAGAQGMHYHSRCEIATYASIEILFNGSFPAPLVGSIRRLRLLTSCIGREKAVMVANLELAADIAVASLNVEGHSLLDARFGTPTAQRLSVISGAWTP